MALGILGVYLVASTVSFCLMATDKRRAEKSRRRISEATLHWVELLGGWPGSFVAQRLFHHKTKKTSYQVVYWMATVANLLMVGGIVSWRAGLFKG